MVEAYYASIAGPEGTTTDKAQITAAWEALEKKTLESLTKTLKDAKYGCGKWMIFSPPSEVDEIWSKIVTALWDGKLGTSAKVSGVSEDPSKSHVICVYVDPFWEVKEVERVLAVSKSAGPQPRVPMPSCRTSSARRARGRLARRSATLVHFASRSRCATIAA